MSLAVRRSEGLMIEGATSLSILVVDGERVAREAFARQFRDGGWSVATAAGRAQALASASVDVPDCLIVERDLADGSGFGLFDRLRALNPELSAIMMTLQPSVTEAVRAIRAGFCDYRLKSLDCGDLVDPSAWRLGPGARPPKDPVKTTRSLARVEWNHIQEVLVHFHGNVSVAARVLGLHRRSLQRKLRRSPREDRRDSTSAALEK
jgi:two-component system response regulator RegA